MALSRGLEALALSIKEAQDAMGHAEVRTKLADAVQSAHPGKWANYVDHTGDGTKGDCIYECEGAMQSCPYEMGEVGGKHTANLDLESAKKVTPSVSYQPVADDVDQYTTMEAAKLYTPGPVPLCERFISKAERDKADAADFAGKGKSFPILKPEDVAAAAQSIGRAGSGNHTGNTIKKNITAIATRKGFALPKDWQGDEDMSMSPSEAAKIELNGEFIALKEGSVGQDGTAFLKLIAPGWGSSGYYSPQLLERDGPRVFRNGLKNFWNHPTAAEESARPEGDLRDLASVLTENAHYEKNGPAGEGLYAKAKVFTEFKQSIDDLAKHIGVSIRASGKAKQGTAPDGKKGVIIESLDHAESADYVTTPGAGGAVLQLFESARKRTTKPQGDEMDATEARRLQESNQMLASEVRKLKERGARLDAADAISEYFTTIRVGEAVQVEVKKTLLERALPLTEAGDLDKAALTKLAEAETVRELEFIERATGRKIVREMGTGTAQPTETQIKEANARDERHSANLANLLEIKGKTGRNIMREGRAAFDHMYNAGERGEKLTVGTEAA